MTIRGGGVTDINYSSLKLLCDNYGQRSDECCYEPPPNGARDESAGFIS